MRPDINKSLYLVTDKQNELHMVYKIEAMKGCFRIEHLFTIVYITGKTGYFIE